jgi:hypothetical protein
MANKRYIKLGAIMKGKEGGLYIKLDDNIDTLNVNGELVKGKFINLEKPEAKYKRMLEAGVMEEAEYEEKVNKIPDFVKYEVVIPPSKS